MSYQMNCLANKSQDSLQSNRNEKKHAHHHKSKESVKDTNDKGSKLEDY